MDIVETPSRNSDALIELTADVVAAYVSNNPVPVGELPNLIADVHAALAPAKKARNRMNSRMENASDR